MPKLGLRGQQLLASGKRAFEGEGAAGAKVWGEEWLVASVEQPLTGWCSWRETDRQEVVKDEAGAITCII